MSIENIINKVISDEGVRAITIIVFLIIIFIAFLGLIAARNKNDEISLQKIIGGLGVFIVAIISQHTYVYILSLFIGGLIIASEKFMMVLAAIMKSDPKDVASIVQYDLEKASPQEIEMEEKKEKRVIEKVVEAEIKIPKTINGEVITAMKREAERKKRMDNYKKDLAKSTKAKALVNEIFQKVLGDQYKTNVKLKNELGKSLLIDGIILKPDDSKSLPTLVEIRYLPLILNDKILDLVIRGAVLRIKKTHPKFPINLVLISGNITKDVTRKTKDQLETKHGININIFTLKEDKFLEPLKYTE